MTGVVLLVVTAVLFGLVWVENLTAPGGLLDWIPTGRPGSKFNHLMECVVCVSGQFALWSYLIAFWSSYDPLTHIEVVFITMGMSYILNRILP